MATPTSIARALREFDPTDLMGGDKEALADFITDYFGDQVEESPEGKPNVNIVASLDLCSTLSHVAMPVLYRFN